MVTPHPARKRAGYVDEGRLRGLNQPAGYPLGAGLVSVAGGFNRPALCARNVTPHPASHALPYGFGGRTKHCIDNYQYNLYTG
jgi:hypothetical protein